MFVGFFVCGFFFPVIYKVGKLVKLWGTYARNEKGHCLMLTYGPFVSIAI